MNEKDALTCLECFAYYACEQFYPFYKELDVREKMFLVGLLFKEIMHFSRLVLNAKDIRVHDK